MTGNTLTGLVLAGGAGIRAGGRDKGLEPYKGRPLVEHVIGRLAPQVDELLISCNRNTRQYARYASRTVRDRRPGFQGPLAGLEAAAPFVRTRYLLIVACDLPQIPPNLAERLLAGLQNKPDAGASFARTDSRDHYLCAAIRTESLATITPFLDEGGRAVRAWLQQENAVGVEFCDGEDAFTNVNRPDQAT